MNALAILLLASAVLAGCDDEACVWSVERVESEHTVALDRDDQAVTLTGSAMTAYSSVDQHEVQETMLSVRLNDEADALYVLQVSLDDATATSVIVLDDSNSSMRITMDMDLVTLWSGVPQGSVTLNAFAAPCELSDYTEEGGGGWACATDFTAVVDVTASTTLGAMHLVASGSQRELLSVACEDCVESPEGCSY